MMHSMIVFLLTVALTLGPIATAATARELGDARPAKLGFSAERLARIPAHLQQYIDAGRVTGFVTLLARDGKVADRRVLGQMDLETGRPMREDAIFRIYSMTKPVVAVALMILHEEGRFSLREPVSKYLPELGGLQVFVRNGSKGLVLEPVAHEATIGELLSHMAGFGYGLVPDHPVEKMYTAAKILDPKTPLELMVRRVAKLPLVHQPGTAWRYSVANDIQGRLVEVISGTTLDRFMQDRLFGPLDMPDTGFIVPAEKLDRFTSNYQEQEDGSLVVIDSPERSTYLSDKKFFSGGGGLVSTARDYLRFGQMLANGGELDGARILSRRTIALMTTNHLPEGVAMDIGGQRMFPGVGYGLGFGVMLDRAEAGSTTSEGSFWWGGAANTGFWVDPKERIVGVLMTQRFPGQLPLAQEFQTLTYQALND